MPPSLSSRRIYVPLCRRVGHLSNYFGLPVPKGICRLLYGPLWSMPLWPRSRLAAVGRFTAPQ